MSGAYRALMLGSKWTTPALMARIDVATALDARRVNVSKERARLRLELVQLVSAVDAGRMGSDEAVARLGGMLDSARALP